MPYIEVLPIYNGKSPEAKKNVGLKKEQEPDFCIGWASNPDCGEVCVVVH